MYVIGVLNKSPHCRVKREYTGNFQSYQKTGELESLSFQNYLILLIKDIAIFATNFPLFFFSEKLMFLPDQFAYETVLKSAQGQICGRIGKTGNLKFKPTQISFVL